MYRNARCALSPSRRRCEVCSEFYNRHLPPVFRLVVFALICIAGWSAPAAHATVYSDVSGIVHDTQHHPLASAEVELKAVRSAFLLRAQTNGTGAFRFGAVPFGEYTLTVSHKGFATLSQTITVASDTSPMLHIALPIATVTQTVNVTGDLAQANVGSVTPTVLLGQGTIESTPGADRSNSLAMITDYVPGSYTSHDMLHIRGGHQVSWLLDGVQIPNTNIASNLGPQINPRDVQYLQVDRGSYNADLGDRTYGVFDVNPKSGFERSREAELTLTAGSAWQTDDQLSFGDHSQRGAYYLSLNGNRSDYGLEPPIERALHDAENGYGGFGSFILNKDAKNQFRLLTQLRTDFFQIPYDPDPQDYENELYDSSGLRDAQHETDGVVAFTWTHSFNPKTVWSVSPFYHYNSASYQPNAADTPTATTSDRASNYAGMQASVSSDVAGNHLEAGFYAWGQHDSNFFAVKFNDASYNNFAEADSAAGGLVEEYVSDNYKPTTFLTLMAGVRNSYFAGPGFSETATYPRVGVALQIPKLHWVLRAFYGHYYQPPALVTVSGPLLGYALGNNTSFAPLHGERDEEHQFGLQIPFKGWLLDADTFQIEASNYLDHTNIGESSIFIPVTVQGALVQAWELTLRSPRLWQRGQVHLAYSNQIAQQRGPITGGLICFPVSSPECDVEPGYTPLDHDQRNTLNVGGDVTLPLRISASTNVYYGSGFANGYPGPPSPYNGEYLPAHTTFDLQLSRSFGEKTTLSVNSTNVANRRVLLDNSLTFGGFHENDPRQIYGEIRYRFHF